MAQSELFCTVLSTDSFVQVQIKGLAQLNRIDGLARSVLGSTGVRFRQRFLGWILITLLTGDYRTLLTGTMVP